MAVPVTGRMKYMVAGAPVAPGEPSTCSGNCQIQFWLAWSRVPIEDQRSSPAGATGTEPTSLYQPAGVSGDGAGWGGWVVARRKMMSTEVPSAATLTGVDQSSSASVPEVPSTAATAREDQTGASPAGTLANQPEGGVRAWNEKLNSPPNGCGGALSLRTKILTSATERPEEPVEPPPPPSPPPDPEPLAGTPSVRHSSTPLGWVRTIVKSPAEPSR